MYTIVKIILKMRILREQIVISAFQMFTAALQSFSHGTNDAQNQWVLLLLL